MTSPIENEAPPTRIPWPPILIAAAIGGGRLLDAIAPVLPGLPALLQIAGAALVALALVNDIWCALTLQRHHTTILPHRAVSRLVTDGPYRFSRNPIYISHVALTFGLGLLLRSPWIALLTPFLAFALLKLAIEPEERHLLGKFGAHYEAYMARTRRWL